MNSYTSTAQKKWPNPRSGTSDSPLHVLLPLIAMFTLTLPGAGQVASYL